jgi:hypothetical protein
MVGVSTAFGIFNYVTYEHEHGRKDLPYQKMRGKPYPWECSDCNLFDLECWKECRGGEKSSH